jgi:hypothetical protein
MLSARQRLVTPSSTSVHIPILQDSKAIPNRLAGFPDPVVVDPPEAQPQAVAIMMAMDSESIRLPVAEVSEPESASLSAPPHPPNPQVQTNPLPQPSSHLRA